MQGEYPLKPSMKVRIESSYLVVNKATMNGSVENPRQWVKVVALK